MDDSARSMERVDDSGEALSVQGESRRCVLYAGGAPRYRGDYACPKRFRSRHPLPQVLFLEQAGVGRAPGSPIIRSACNLNGAGTRQNQETTMAVVTIRQLLDSGVHFGHSDPSVEPEGQALHPHRAQRHPHHRPPAVARLHRQGLRLRQGDRRPRWHDPLRRHQEAGAGDPRRAGDACRPALREPAVARGLLTNFQTISKRLARMKELEELDYETRRTALHEEGAPAQEA